MSELQGGEGAALASDVSQASETSGGGLLLTSEQRRHMRIWLGVLGGLATCSLIGSAFAMYLVSHQPLLLILLSPLARHLVLVAHSVDPVAFVVLATLRRFAFYVPCFELGREFGASAIDMLDRRLRGLRPYIGVIQRVFAAAPHVFVCAFPGPVLGTLAGSAGMRRSAYVPLVLMGLCLRMWFWLEFADWASEPIGVVLDFIDRYWIEGTILLIACIALYQWRQWRRGAQDTLA